MLACLSRFFWSAIYYIQVLLSWLNIPSFIYDNAITKPLTKYTYMKLLERMKPSIDQYKKVLDVGTGTGRALHVIFNQFPEDTQIVGIDIDKNYIAKAKERFKNCSNVEMRDQNFYALNDSKERYDAIIFSNSFTLMPFREKAIEIASNMLSPNGKIFFLMALYERNKEFVENIKPFVKHYTTIDFGNITYEAEFERMLTNNGLDITHKERIFYNWNPLFFLFRIFMVEAQQVERV